MKLLLLILLVTGCAGLPGSYSIGGASPTEAEIIATAVDQWCAAVGWCPTRTNDGELHFSVTKRFEDDPFVRAHNEGDRIQFDRTYFREYPEDLHVVALHEIGHLCTDHLSTGIMRADQTEASDPVVDPAAIRAWHAGCD